MRLRTTAAYAATFSALVLAGANIAAAQDVTFSDLRDAVPAKFFDAAASQPSASNPNELEIGFNKGFDFRTFSTNDFSASALPFGNRTAADTISFVVTAPAGFYVSKITYTQRGTASFFRGSVQSGTTQSVVAGFPSSLGIFRDPNLSGTADLKELALQSVPVSITVALFAAATGYIAVTEAAVLVDVAPLVIEAPPVDDPLPVDTPLPVNAPLPLIRAPRVP